MQFIRHGFRHLVSSSMLRSMHTLRQSCVDRMSPILPISLPDVLRFEQQPFIPTPHPSHISRIILPSDLIICPLSDEFTQPLQTPMEAKTDIKNRRRKMKHHQKRKWNKSHISLVRKLRMQQEKKEESKLQELFAFWKRSAEAWDPKQKMENQLNLARRYGYHIDILNTPGSPLYKPPK